MAGCTVQIGVVYPQIELGGDPMAVRRFGRAVEELGFDHLLAYDNVLGAVHAGRTPRLTDPYTERDPFDDPFVMFAHGRHDTARLRAGLTGRHGQGLGIGNVVFEVYDLQAAVDWAATQGYGLVGGIGEYESAWRMAYLRGPQGIIVSLAELIG